MIQKVQQMSLTRAVEVYRAARADLDAIEQKVRDISQAFREGYLFLHEKPVWEPDVFDRLNAHLMTGPALRELLEERAARRENLSEWESCLMDLAGSQPVQ